MSRSTIHRTSNAGSTGEVSDLSLETGRSTSTLGGQGHGSRSSSQYASSSPNKVQEYWNTKALPSFSPPAFTFFKGPPPPPFAVDALSLPQKKKLQQHLKHLKPLAPTIQPETEYIKQENSYELHHLTERQQCRILKNITDYVRLFSGSNKHRYHLDDIEYLFAHPVFLPTELTQEDKNALGLLMTLRAQFTSAKMRPLQWFDIITGWKTGFHQTMDYQEFSTGLARFCDEKELSPWEEEDIDIIFQFFLRSPAMLMEADSETNPVVIRRHDFKVAFKKLQWSQRRKLWLNHQANIIRKLQRFIHKKLRSQFRDFSMDYLTSLKQMYQRRAHHDNDSDEKARSAEISSTSMYLSSPAKKTTHNVHTLSAAQLETTLSTILCDYLIFLRTKNRDAVLHRYYRRKDAMLKGDNEHSKQILSDDETSSLASSSMGGLDVGDDMSTTSLFSVASSVNGHSETNQQQQVHSSVNHHGYHGHVDHNNLLKTAVLSNATAHSSHAYNQQQQQQLSGQSLNLQAAPSSNLSPVTGSPLSSSRRPPAATDLILEEENDNDQQFSSDHSDAGDSTVDPDDHFSYYKHPADDKQQQSKARRRQSRVQLTSSAQPTQPQQQQQPPQTLQRQASSRSRLLVHGNSQSNIMVVDENGGSENLTRKSLTQVVLLSEQKKALSAVLALQGLPQHGSNYHLLDSTMNSNGNYNNAASGAKNSGHMTLTSSNLSQHEQQTPQRTIQTHSVQFANVSSSPSPLDRSRQRKGSTYGSTSATKAAVSIPNVREIQRSQLRASITRRHSLYQQYIEHQLNQKQQAQNPQPHQNLSLSTDDGLRALSSSPSSANHHLDSPHSVDSPSRKAKTPKNPDEITDEEFAAFTAGMEALQQQRLQQDDYRILDAAFKQRVTFATNKLASLR